ncbi:MAG: hypothetical protein MJ227_03300 [Bacilli bacterium]|nr:hypothetical protein [Bacilli bacterium]
MTIYYIIFAFLSILFAGVNYIVSNNLLTTIIVIVGCFLYFYIVGMRRLKKHTKRTNEFLQCYNFINSFIIGLSIKENITSSYEITLSSMNEEFLDEVKDINDLDSFEKLKYLDRYFQFDIYTLFVSLIEIYQEEGGNILDMSRFLLDELRNDYTYFETARNMGRRKIFEFGTLWFFSVLVLVIIRFALTDFYRIISPRPFFYISVVVMIAFLVFSIDFLIAKITKIKIRGWKHETH